MPIWTAKRTLGTAFNPNFESAFYRGSQLAQLPASSLKNPPQVSDAPTGTLATWLVELSGQVLLHVTEYVTLCTLALFKLKGGLISAHTPGFPWLEHAVRVVSLTVEGIFHMSARHLECFMLMTPSLINKDANTACIAFKYLSTISDCYRASSKTNLESWLRLHAVS